VAFADPDGTRFIEPVITLPIYCDGLAMVETTDGKMHFALYVKQPVPGAMEFERVINLRVIMPNDGVASALPAVIRKLTGIAVDKVTETGWRMLGYCSDH
jgi:hypothetical protein